MSSSTAADRKLLAAPVTLFHSGKTAPNVFLKSAMTERLCEWDDDEAQADYRGRPTEEYLQLYREWGKAGGSGVIILGNVPVNRLYPEAKGNLIIDKTAAKAWNHLECVKEIVAVAKAGSGGKTLIIAQLTHAGRQTPDTICQAPVSASDIQTGAMGGMTFCKPRPMTIDEIKDTIDRFAYAAKIFYDAGADGVQMHAAHGYLLSQFLSPRVNKRTDIYGGSYENRSRFLFEIIAAIRNVVPDPKFILSIKINSADFHPSVDDPGFSVEDSQKTIVRLDEAGLDIIELSGGSYESGAFEHKKESTIKREAFFIEYAAAILPQIKHAKLCLTGGFRSTSAMASALREGATHFIGLARPLTAEPDLAKLLIEGEQPKARENLVPAPMQTGSSIRQIKDIAQGLPIRDYSKEAVASETTKEMLSAMGIAPTHAK